MINIGSVNQSDMAGFLILLLLFVLLLFCTINYYINLPKEIKEVKGFILGQFSGFIALLIAMFVAIIEILFQTSGLATTLSFILFCASASGVAYGNQILLKNKDKVHLSEEEVNRRKALIPWQYGVSIFTTVLCLVLLFI